MDGGGSEGVALVAVICKAGGRRRWAPARDPKSLRLAMQPIPCLTSLSGFENLRLEGEFPSSS